METIINSINNPYYISPIEIAIIQCEKQGGIWNYATNQCMIEKSTTKTCPQGEQLIGDTCFPIKTTCPNGEKLINGQCLNVQDCESGYYKNSEGICVPIPCPDGEEFINGYCQKISSPPTSTSTTTSTTTTTSSINLMDFLGEYKYYIFGGIIGTIILLILMRKK